MGGLVFLVANRLELEGAVRDVEVPAKAFAEPVQHLAGAALVDAGVVQDDMHGQNRYAAGDRPRVQIVDIDHATHFLDVLPYFSKVHAVRRGFQEHVHDVAATILHLLWLDHKKLTYRFQGRDFRLTDVAGHVIHKLLA